MYVSSPSITLNCGSANSFFSAVFFTAGSTSRATKRVKSEAGVSARASSIVGAGGAGSGGAGAASAITDAGATGAVGSAAPGSGSSAGARPSRTSALRRDQRDRKPSSPLIADPACETTPAAGAASARAGSARR